MMKLDMRKMAVLNMARPPPKNRNLYLPQMIFGIVDLAVVATLITNRGNENRLWQRGKRFSALLFRIL